jgi:hypothetical protein
LAVGSWQLAVGSWQLAVGSWQLAVGSWQLAVGSWQNEDYKISICLVCRLFFLKNFTINKYARIIN